MNCDDVFLLAEAFHDSELDTARTMELAEHLEHCPGCRRRQSELSNLNRVTQARLNQGSRTGSLWQGIESVVMTESSARDESKTPWWRELLWPNPQCYLALATVWLVMLGLQWRMNQDTPQTDAVFGNISPETITALGWQREQLAQLLGTDEETPAAKPPVSLSPRSENLSPNAGA